MSGPPRIFIQIAAYRDAELVPTLRDCVERAAEPGRLRFGICWQCDEGDSLAEFADDSRVRTWRVAWHASRGLGWARSICQRLWRGEEYTLQLDAHHRFVDGWDEILIGMHRDLGGGRALLTTYAGAYRPGDPSEAMLRATVPSKITAQSFREYGTIVLVPRPIDDYLDRVRPVRARFVSGHFYFTVGIHCVEYRYDPDLYFLGDELSLSVRSWCLGYDLFHPHRQVIFHYFLREAEHKPWADTDAPAGSEVSRWAQREADGLSRLRQLLGMEAPKPDAGRYGLSRRRPLSGYERYAGVDFSRRWISEEAREGVEPRPS